MHIKNICKRNVTEKKIIGEKIKSVITVEEDLNKQKSTKFGVLM